MIKVKLLNDLAKVPSRANIDDAGLDLFSTEKITIMPKEWAKVPTGICMEIPGGYYGRIAPRSGLAVNYGIDVFAGVIDSSYRGEVIVILYNAGGLPFEIEIGQKIAQLIIEMCQVWTPEVVFDLPGSPRGTGGFGSSGN